MLVVLAVLVVGGIVVFWRLKDTANLWNWREYRRRKKTKGN